MTIQDDDLDAALLFPKVASAMARLVRECYDPLRKFAQVEKERLRHQTRANDEAVRNETLRKEIELLRIRAELLAKSLKQIASASPHVCHHATGDVRCCVCWAMIDLAREALGWEKWPAMSGTIIIKTKGDK